MFPKTYAAPPRPRSLLQCLARSARRACSPAARQAIAKQSARRERRAMYDPTAKLNLARQAKVLGISRGSVYYLPRPVGEADL